MSGTRGKAAGLAIDRKRGNNSVNERIGPKNKGIDCGKDDASKNKVTQNLDILDGIERTYHNKIICAKCGADLTGKGNVLRNGLHYCALPGCGYPERVQREA